MYTLPWFGIKPHHEKRVKKGRVFRLTPTLSHVFMLQSLGFTVLSKPANSGFSCLFPGFPVQRFLRGTLVRCLCDVPAAS